MDTLVSGLVKILELDLQLYRGWGVPVVIGASFSRRKAEVKLILWAQMSKQNLIIFLWLKDIWSRGQIGFILWSHFEMWCYLKKNVILLLGNDCEMTVEFDCQFALIFVMPKHYESEINLTPEECLSVVKMLRSNWFPELKCIFLPNDITFLWLKDAWSWGQRAVYQSVSANSFWTMSKFEFAITRNKNANIQNWGVFQTMIAFFELFHF